MFKVFFYEDSEGNSEIKNYIQDLQKKKDKDSHIKYNKVVSYIDMLKKYGLALENKYIKHIEGEIWELRPIRDRILFAYYENNSFILLSLFVKKTQKTPKREIERAKMLLQEYNGRG